MGLKEHAIRELKIIGYDDDSLKDEMNKAMYDNIISLIDTFASQGHSGFSAEYATRIFNKLASQQALSPLTKSADEWNDVSEHNDGKELWQSNRDSRFFSKDGGETWYNVDDNEIVKPVKKEEAKKNDVDPEESTTPEGEETPEGKPKEESTTEVDIPPKEDDNIKKTTKTEVSDNESTNTEESGKPKGNDSVVPAGNEK